jgi:hypothetical protein
MARWLRNVTARQYDVVRLPTIGGLEGAAYAFGRGLLICSLEAGLAELDASSVVSLMLRPGAGTRG